MEDPLPKDPIHKSLDRIARLNMPASRFGMVDAVFADGKPCIEGGPDGDRIWSRHIFIQGNAAAARVDMYHGRRQEGEKAAQTMLDTLFRRPLPMPWSQPCGINSLTGATTPGHDDYDPWSSGLIHSLWRAKTSERLAPPEGCSTQFRAAAQFLLTILAERQSNTV